MKTKILMFLMAIGMLLAAPTLYGQDYTDDEIDFAGGDATNNEFGPVSLDPVLIHGIYSNAKQTLTLEFFANMGVMTIWIVDEQGTLYISKEVNTIKEAMTVIDLQGLPEQKYTIICFNPKGEQRGEFNYHK